MTNRSVTSSATSSRVRLARDAAQRAMDKLMLLVQLRVSRIVKGNFDA